MNEPSTGPEKHTCAPGSMKLCCRAAFPYRGRVKVAAADSPTGTALVERLCPVCGQPIRVRDRGPVPGYCSDAHRKWAARARAKGRQGEG